jgi:[acyl-carrier-protein] S-malonyltransferase
MLEKTAFADARMPVVQNVDAQPSRDAAVLRQGLIDQLTQPVRWTQTLEQLARQGIQQLVECGPGNVLSNLAKRLPEPLPCHPIDTRSRLDDALAAVLMAEGKLA